MCYDQYGVGLITIAQKCKLRAVGGQRLQYVHCLKEMDEQEIGREYLAAAAKMLEKCQAVSPQTQARRQSGLIR